MAGMPTDIVTAADSPAAALAARAAVDQLRAGGHRVTLARRAVIEALAAATEHPTVEELRIGVEPRLPGVHLATVYRTLQTLMDLGVARHIHMGHGATTYHLADSQGRPDHLHAQCLRCGQVLDLPADLLSAVGDRLERDEGFLLADHHVALSGACRSCRTDT